MNGPPCGRHPAPPAEGWSDERVEIIGPFTYHQVVVGGWSVPYLHAWPVNGGKIELSLDERYGIELDVGQADNIIRFIAHAIAVAHGFTCQPHDDIPPTSRLPWHRVHGVVLEDGS